MPKSRLPLNDMYFHLFLIVVTCKRY